MEDAFAGNRVVGGCLGLVAAIGALEAASLVELVCRCSRPSARLHAIVDWGLNRTKHILKSPGVVFAQFVYDFVGSRMQ